MVGTVASAKKQIPCNQPDYEPQVSQHGIQPRGAGKTCCFTTSLFFNVLLVGILIAAGVYMCRYRRELHRLLAENSELSEIDYGFPEDDEALQFQEAYNDPAEGAEETDEYVAYLPEDSEVGGESMEYASGKKDDNLFERLGFSRRPGRRGHEDPPGFRHDGSRGQRGGKYFPGRHEFDQEDEIAANS